jgi:uncharacterized protein with PIN domain
MFITFMNKKCPACQAGMKKVASGMELPSLPFLKIPEWIKEAHAYECDKCGYIGLWRGEKTDAPASASDDGTKTER